MTYVFICVFIVLAVAEMLRPGVSQLANAPRRWFGNLTIFFISWSALALPFAAAVLAQSGDGPGLFGYLRVPAWCSVAFGVVIIDAAAYAFHRTMHAVPLLWRVHAVHHSDPDLDITTTLRQHPLSVWLEAVVLAGVVVVFGLPAAAVLIYRVSESVVQSLAHANIGLPPWRSAILVTPRFHRLHHSRDMVETNSNYGQVLVIWDHMFGTARTAPVGPERFGLDGFTSVRAQDPDRLLLQPFQPRPALDTAPQPPSSAIPTRNQSPKRATLSPLR